MSNSTGCPVDHSTPPETKPAACPADHNPHSTWSRFFSSSPPSSVTPLSTQRQVSSIPRAADEHWVYPSEAQFFNAMARKNHNPEAADMKSIVPIHNAVNERAWAEILRWEAGRGGEACGGVKLVNFQGKPGDRSPRARWKMLLGYSGPFDRHDWIVDRCGTHTRYIIDFYTGRSQGGPSNNMSFYLDVRPALDNWEGVKMRVEHFFGRTWATTTASNIASQLEKRP